EQRVRSDEPIPRIPHVTADQDVGFRNPGAREHRKDRECANEDSFPAGSHGSYSSAQRANISLHDSEFRKGCGTPVAPSLLRIGNSRETAIGASRGRTADGYWVVL